jgi:hypothetical protein
MSLSLDYEYQRKIADKLSKFNKSWEPYTYSGGSVDRQYVQPGSSAAYPMFNQDTLAKINSGRKTKENAMIGKGNKLGISPDSIGIYEGGCQAGCKGGKLTKKKIIKNAKPVLKTIGKHIVSKGLDIGVPALTTAIGTYFGNPIIGAQAGLLGRKIIKTTTGYGVPVNKKENLTQK